MDFESKTLSRQDDKSGQGNLDMLESLGGKGADDSFTIVGEKTLLDNTGGEDEVLSNDGTPHIER